MQRLELRVKPKKRFRVTTDSKHGLPITKNHLNRRFKADRPNQKWVGNITYIWTDEGWAYLAAVEDLFSRKIVGWTIEDHMKAELVVDALNRATVLRSPPKGLLMHSDRGSQYAGALHQETLERLGAKCSMSRKGNCWDNAAMESFFGTLKKDLVYRRRFRTRAEAKEAVGEYIDRFYNARRRHSSLDYVSPNQFEAAYASREKLKPTKSRIDWDRVPPPSPSPRPSQTMAE